MSQKDISRLESLRVTINCLEQKFYRAAEWLRAKRTNTWNRERLSQLKNVEKLERRIKCLNGKYSSLYELIIWKYKKAVEMYICNDVAGIVVEYLR